MGYTHYFTYRPDAPGFAEAFAKLQMDALAISAFARELEPEARVGRVTYPEGDRTNFEISDKICDEGTISFNGIGPDGKGYGFDYSCETFWMAVNPMSFYQTQDDYSAYIRTEFERAGGCFTDFIKTRQYPYDAVVTCLLIRAKDLIPEFSVGSDGTWDEWTAGRSIYERIFNKDAECPFDVVTAS